MRFVKIDLSKYANLSICAAVSGGRDSMALLHYLLAHAEEYGITVSAVNVDHKMRGESSSRDSAFVSSFCARNKVPLIFFEWNTDEPKNETSARLFRLSKYAEAAAWHILPDGSVWKGADAVATAHHLNDVAETVLFNLARGSGLSGLTGVCDKEMNSCGGRWKLIRPLSGVSRAEIDGYVAENSVPYVDDETNFTDDCTRNKIRLNVLPELEKAVPHAARAIYRFSRIAAEDEAFFEKLIEERGILKITPSGCEIARCEEKPLFNRAVLKFLNGRGVPDYTCARLQKLYDLQFAAKGKKFVFSGCTAYAEDGKIAICIENQSARDGESVSFWEFLRGGNLAERKVSFTQDGSAAKQADGRDLRILRFDLDKIPKDAVLRHMAAGDRFLKFGGGAKNLGSYFTDLKIPVRLRGEVPVVACGNEILIVCGVEISESVRVGETTENIAFCFAPDYVAQGKR